MLQMPSFFDFCSVLGDTVVKTGLEATELISVYIQMLSSYPDDADVGSWQKSFLRF